MSTRSIFTEVFKPETMNRLPRMHSPESTDGPLMHPVSSGFKDAAHDLRDSYSKSLSSWSRSPRKRLFDCACVLLALPLLLPAFLLIALAVRLTSRGPVLFLQKRIGRHGKAFTILKFRTMVHVVHASHHAVTTANNQRFTPVGPFLRRFKLDELPQLINVLAGQMSLVGPRPKMPEHVVSELACRPGITGAATIAFALEEMLLDRIPKHDLNDYYHSVVLPAKNQLDASYMAKATFRSDLRLIVDSVLRRWDNFTAENLLNAWEFEAADKQNRARAHAVTVSHSHTPIPPKVDRPVTAEQISGY